MPDATEVPRIHLGDLQPGDIVLLTASVGLGGRVDPVGGSVQLLDGVPYSHAVVLEHAVGPSRDFTSLGANQSMGGTVASGVNRLSLRWFNFATATRRGRELLVLRHRDPAVVRAALTEAPCWVDSANHDPSDFGWEQIALSAAFAWSRHLEPDWRRRVFQATVRRISDALLPPQRPDGNPSCGDRAEGPAQRWDCCHFVDHLFSPGGRALGTLERDPPEDRDASALLRAFLEMWGRELLAKLCGGPPATEAGDAELEAFVSVVLGPNAVEGDRGTFRQLVRALLCIRRVPLITEDPGEGASGLVWGPFSTPRLLAYETPALRVVGRVPPGGLDPPTGR